MGEEEILNYFLLSYSPEYHRTPQQTKEGSSQGFQLPEAQPTHNTNPIKQKTFFLRDIFFLRINGQNFGGGGTKLIESGVRICQLTIKHDKYWILH